MVTLSTYAAARGVGSAHRRVAGPRAGRQVCAAQTGVPRPRVGWQAGRGGGEC